MRISRSLYDRITADAMTTPGIERCGLLFGDVAGAASGALSGALPDGEIRDFAPARNVHADPARHFEVDPAALIAAYRAERGGGPRLIGHYHSHPDGAVEPSPRDAAAAVAGSMLWLVIAGASAQLWRPVALDDGGVGFARVALTIAD